MVTNSDLRAMVREVLREALAARATGAAALSVAGGPAAARGASAPAPARGAPQPVRIAGEDDLQAFVAHLATPGVIEAVRAGALRFTLDAAQGGAATARMPAAPAGEVVTLDGVVSERRLQAVPRGARVHLAPGAVLTPLARDVARRLGLSIQRRDA